MTVQQLIDRLQACKHKDAIIVIADQKGFDMHFSKDIDVYEQEQNRDEIDWDDGAGDAPKRLPAEQFQIVILDC